MGRYRPVLIKPIEIQVIFMYERVCVCVDVDVRVDVYIW